MQHLADHGTEPAPVDLVPLADDLGLVPVHRNRRRAVWVVAALLYVALCVWATARWGDSDAPAYPEESIPSPATTELRP